MTDEFKALLRETRAALFDLQLFHLARKLSGGKSVRVEWVELPEDVRGQTVRDGAKVIIQIDQTQTDDVLQTFCHECAHVRMHLAAITDRSAPAPAIPGNFDPQRVREFRAAIHKQREAEADALAAKWLKVAGVGKLRERVERLLESTEV